LAVDSHAAAIRAKNLSDGHRLQSALSKITTAKVGGFFAKPYFVLI